TLLEAAGLDGSGTAPPSLVAGAPADVIAERERIEPPAWAAAGSARARARIGRTRALYRDRWKLVVDGLGARLYDFAADPGERRDVSAEHPDLTRSLGDALPAWPEHEEIPTDGEAPTPPETGLTEAEEAQIKDQLALLGYLE